MPNEEIIFTYHDDLEYFTPTAPVSVFIKYKLQKGKKSQWVKPVVDHRYFSLQDYREILEDKNWSESRKYALAKLYCDLASLGLLKHFCTFARCLGFNIDEIAEAGEHYGEKLKKSKLYKHIKKLNGNLQIRQLISDDEAFLQDWISEIADPEMASAATMKWTRKYSYEVLYVNKDIVSFCCRVSSYTGGAHGNHYIKVGTLYCGKRLRLADLPDLDKIKKLFQQALKSHKDYKEIIAYNHGKEVKMTENFYIDGEGIHFIYDPYEINCYAAGTIDILVPYEVDFSAK